MQKTRIIFRFKHVSFKFLFKQIVTNKSLKKEKSTQIIYVVIKESLAIDQVFKKFKCFQCYQILATLGISEYRSILLTN